MPKINAAAEVANIFHALKLFLKARLNEQGANFKGKASSPGANN